MSTRTYAPQLAKMLKRVSVYYSKHKASIDPVIAGQANLANDLQQIVSTINAPNGWGSVVTTEKP